MRIETYQSKDQQSRFFREQEVECYLWLTQNFYPWKTSSIISMMEQMVETRSWRVARGLIEDGRCRVCHGHDETVEHLVAGYIVFSYSEYLTRHKSVLKILTVTCAKEHKLDGAGTVCYKERSELGMVLENNKAKLLWYNSVVIKAKMLIKFGEKNTGVNY